MSEISAGGTGGTDEISVGSEGLNDSSGAESLSVTDGTESLSNNTGLDFTIENQSIENISFGISTETKETNNSPLETMSVHNQILEIPSTIEQAQKEVESYHRQSINQILETNGKYMSEKDITRVSNGADNIQAIEHNPMYGRTGGYLLSNGKSNIEVSAINDQQIERSTKHETNHFASKNREIIVPEPDKKGYTVYQTVGTRQSSWFHSTETGQNSNFTSKGRGLNEGLTTMYTNQQLSEISKEKGDAARRQGIYSHATELCEQLENIVGKDSLKEAYYGGNLQGLESKVNSLAGDKGYENLRECMDRTLSKDYSERIQAMKDAQRILADMYERRKSA